MIRKDLGNVSGAVAIDCAEARAFEFVATGSLTIAAPAGLPEWEFFMVKGRQDSYRPGDTFTWDSAYVFDGGAAGPAFVGATVDQYVGFRRFGNKFVATFTTRG
jgi:hypothetical protein